MEWLPPFERALQDLAATLIDADMIDFDVKTARLHVGVEGAFGDLHVTPRSLGAKYLSHMVCLDGIVTSCSLIRPKLLRSVHWSEAGKTFMAKEYHDATMILQGGSAALQSGSNAYPTEDDQHRRLISEFGLSTYRDYQTVTVQEMPERAPPGQLPRSVDVILDDDLVDKVKPGDRIRIVGVFRGMAGLINGSIPNSFRSVVIANSIRLLSKTLQFDGKLSEKEEAIIKQLAQSQDPLKKLLPSIAPSIYGHESIKRAIVLQQVGGVEKNLPNGTHIRGDINILLIGDPSTAKSQMLRYVLGVAPLAVATTGRGSSGVGLTAAVVSDKETGERRLEAGAMVLADRGVVCIDEFDKMSDLDRVAIHEVMEQQTVTIAKAGIHTTLNARCSVLAAANPVYGCYNVNKAPQENIRLPDSLLSRFDLMFIVLDKHDPESDRRIADHVLRMHRHVPHGHAEGAVIPDKLSIYSSFGEDSSDGDASTESSSDMVPLALVKKYLLAAKSKRPVLSDQAIKLIVDAYCEFRQQRELSTIIDESSNSSMHRTFPVTPRTLETCIRLATANAKLRLADEVNETDAQIAVDLIEQCLYLSGPGNNKKKKRGGKKQRNNNDIVDHDDQDHDQWDGNQLGGKDKEENMEEDMDRDDKGKQVDPDMMSSLAIDDYSFSSSYNHGNIQGTQSNTHSQPKHKQLVMDALNKQRQDTNDTIVTIDRLLQDLPSVIDKQDVERVLISMEADNQIMYRDGLIIFI